MSERTDRRGGDIVRMPVFLVEVEDISNVGVSMGYLF